LLKEIFPTPEERILTPRTIEWLQAEASSRFSLELDNSSPYYDILLNITSSINKIENAGMPVPKDLFDSLYIIMWYNVVENAVDHYDLYDYDHVQDFSTLQPQSESEQNVKYLDSIKPYMDAISSDIDVLRTSTTDTDVPLGEFLSRPVLLDNFVWQNDQVVSQSINPWELFIKNKRVANRVSNYKLLTGNLHIKIVVNGTPFHYGRLLASYIPMALYDDSLTGTFNDADLVLLSQRLHSFINPSDNDGGEMTLPLFWWKNTIDTTVEGNTNDFAALGTLYIITMNLLKQSNGGSDPVNVSVYGWMTNVGMSVPTAKNIVGLSPQSKTTKRVNNTKTKKDEYSAQGPVSGVASAVANVAGKLTSVPYIGNFARATQIGATAAAGIASLFGYSRPTNLESCVYRPVGKSSLAITTTPDDTQKLSVDAQQELTIDSCVFGMNDSDPMEILKIAQVESYLGQFPWTDSTTQENQLFSCIVDPSLAIKSSVPTNFLAMPAITFACTPFRYWRGTIKFRFMVVCSRYHKGRLKVVYDPYGQSNVNGEYNVAYTTVVDISETTDFTIECGWGQATTYRERMPLGAISPPYATTGTLAYTSDSEPYGNGVISVYCVNDVTSPAPPTNISVNVFVSAGDDFEVAGPDGSDLARLRVQNKHVTTLKPQSDEALRPTTEAEEQPDNPTGVPTVHEMGPQLSLTDPANLVHFGESIRSFRQMIKRYTAHEYAPLLDKYPANKGKVYVTRQRHALPFVPGYTSSGGGTNQIVYPLQSGGYVYGNMTLLRYLTLGFAAWRGGVRYILDFSEGLDDVTSVVVCRSTTVVPENATTELQQPNAATGAAQRIKLKKDLNGIEGAVLQPMSVNRLVAFEVPFYSQYRFLPSRTYDDFGSGTNPRGPPLPKSKVLPNPSWRTGYAVNAEDTGGLGQNTALSIWVAGAEDFNVGWYQGPPLFWLEDTPPTA